MAAEEIKTPDPGSLRNLEDIVMPDPVSWWPLAPGWYWVLAILLLFAAVSGYCALRRWRANAYRRSALREIDQLPATAAEDPIALATGITTLLKRVAVTAYPRSEVASLSGKAWLAFLDRTGNTGAFTKGAGAVLASIPYRSSAAPASVDQARAVIGIARDWIIQHTVHPESS